MKGVVTLSLGRVFLEHCQHTAKLSLAAQREGEVPWFPGGKLRHRGIKTRVLSLAPARLIFDLLYAGVNQD